MDWITTYIIILIAEEKKAKEGCKWKE